jgi:hypothetical protein
MLATSIPADLLLELARLYESNPRQFLHIPSETMACVAVREAIAELRNNNFLEEEVRGVVRFTRLGYKVFQRELIQRKFPSAETQTIAELPAWA